MTDQHIDLLLAQDDDGESEVFRTPLCTSVGLFASGVFDGATLKFLVNPVVDKLDAAYPNEWYEHPDGIFTDLTEDAVKFWTNADLAETWMKATVENAGDNTLLNLRVRPRTVWTG